MPDNALVLREVGVMEAIEHAIWESDVCIGQWAFCASLAMLRKAIDLWSGKYRDEHGMTFDRAKKEKDNLYWRLTKIAEANPLYKASIHDLIDRLRLDANDVVHNNFVCAGGMTGTSDASAIVAIRVPFIELQSKVLHLISSTTPGWTPVMSDHNRWRDKPRGATEPAPAPVADPEATRVRKFFATNAAELGSLLAGIGSSTARLGPSGPNDPRLIKVDERLREFESERPNLPKLNDDRLSTRLKTTCDGVRLEIVPSFRRQLDSAWSDPDRRPQLGNEMAKQSFSHVASSMQHAGGTLQRLSQELSQGAKS